MSIDVRRQRRDTPFKCCYWKRDVNGTGDSDTLTNNKKCDGYFYAKMVEDKSKDEQDIANVWNTHYQSVTLLTHDVVNLEANDLVRFGGKLWIVERVSEKIIQKQAYFSSNLSKDTKVVLRNGN